MNRRVIKRAVIGAAIGGGGAAGLLWISGVSGSPLDWIIDTSMFAAVGAVAGIGSLWRERGLPPLTCVAVVGAFALAAHVVTRLVVGFCKFNDYPMAPMLIAAAVGVVVVLKCRKLVVGRKNEPGNIDRPGTTAGDDSPSNRVNNLELGKRLENTRKLRQVTDENERLRCYIDEMEDTGEAVDGA